MSSTGSFAGLAGRSAGLLVQPRMGFSDPARMRAGLDAVRRAGAATVGTLTLDSYTRVKDYDSAGRALADALPLNGYPLVTHGPDTTRAVLDGIQGPDFPVQVRHGSALPDDIIAALVAAGLDATEGGPVSYCLPYSRVPLREATAGWARSCERFAELRDRGVEPHLESFGGCMMGQLCPPGLLIAITVLEGLFFHRHGLRSISLSYAQQTDARQDEEAVAALRSLATAFLPDDTDWHIVVYAYMGKYPRTHGGALLVLRAAAGLAVRTGATRLIVKTPAESYRIPTIEENVEALEFAGAAAAAEATRTPPDPAPPPDTGIAAEARQLIEAVLDLHPDVGQALVRAFAKGYLDVPYCLHADNHGRSRGYIDEAGRLRWASVGSMPIRGITGGTREQAVGSSELLSALSYVERTHDLLALRSQDTRTSDALDAGTTAADLRQA
ncbi:methylaspartate mutase [Streptomyces rugosispiralis]|uniref:Methylaspartate mutase n=1 Tax=Streptomyces rugosispiralis TaxID=2967341 RepID=A0ABT1UNV5_9ACTN|nr:methylaspartate mutase [Streptomyces rugosispiralis]MCQ8186815.1 methylaspartate mutase [Streptomyces rugosispiralis]